MVTIRGGIMKTEKEIINEINTIREMKKQLVKTKYPCTSTALSFIQLQAQEEILEWIIQECE